MQTTPSSRSDVLFRRREDTLARHCHPFLHTFCVNSATQPALGPTFASVSPKTLHHPRVAHVSWTASQLIYGCARQFGNSQCSLKHEFLDTFGLFLLHLAELLAQRSYVASLTSNACETAVRSFPAFSIASASRRFRATRSEVCRVRPVVPIKGLLGHMAIELHAARSGQHEHT